MLRVVVILSLLQLVAFWKILGRMGFPPWLAIMASSEGRLDGPPGGEGDAKF